MNVASDTQHRDVRPRGAPQEKGQHDRGTRDRLISATGRLLRRQGYAATGLNQVMAEADAPKGSMYFHFPGGKEELAAAAVDRFAERITAKMTDLLARRSVADAIGGFFDSYIEYFERTEYRDGCVVATVALDEAGTHEMLAAAASQALHTWVDLVADALEAEGRSPERAHGLATLVIASLEGTIVMAKGQRSVEPFVATRQALREILASD
jgi:TetR/AcrR family transcriptional repressor of lmrAB and yxaGH operons